MKRKRIKGLKTPGQTCLALISLLSGTDSQKECSKPEVLLAVMRPKYQLCEVWCVQYATTHLLPWSLIWFPALFLLAETPGVGGGHDFHSSQEVPKPWLLWGSLHPQPLTLHGTAEHSHEELHGLQHSTDSVQCDSPSCQPTLPWQHLFDWIWGLQKAVHLLDSYPTTFQDIPQVPGLTYLKEWSHWKRQFS